METSIEIDPGEYGYCQQCGRPEWVGTLHLRGWLHAISICRVCLEALAQAVGFPKLPAA